MLVHGLLPISAPDAKILILGSMPGAESLKTRQYYAHPQNQFWSFMGVLFGAEPKLPYAERVAILKSNKIAVWDVLHSCAREGCLDSAIKQEIANDFDGFFAEHTQIKHIFLCGTKAEQSFRKHIKSQLPQTRLPSTSPMRGKNVKSPEQKLQDWSKVLAALES